MATKAYLISSRRRAREAALQALYQCDTLDQWTSVSVELYFSIFQNNSDNNSAVTDSGEDVAAKEVPDYQAFARSLAFGVIEHIKEIDAQISSASTHWSMCRMARVDRNILRLATFEMLHCSDIPLNVSLNEAIEISKRFGSEDTPAFINGVLDNIAHALIAQGILAESKLASAS